MTASTYSRKFPVGRRGAAAAMTTCQICGQQVPTDEIQEHMRIELLDPKWKLHRDMLEARKAQASELQKGADVSAAFKTLARARVDIFGDEEDEAARDRERQEQEASAKQREKNVWDGHTASKTSTMEKYQSSVNFDEQIAAIHRAKGLTYVSSRDVRTDAEQSFKRQRVAKHRPRNRTRRRPAADAPRSSRDPAKPRTCRWHRRTSRADWHGRSHPCATTSLRTTTSDDGTCAYGSSARHAPSKNGAAGRPSSTTRGPGSQCRGHARGRYAASKATTRPEAAWRTVLPRELLLPRFGPPWCRFS